MYKLTLRCVRVTIVAVEKYKLFNIMNVCIYILAWKILKCDAGEDHLDRVCRKLSITYSQGAEEYPT
jgi:hypothetical protein